MKKKLNVVILEDDKEIAEEIAEEIAFRLSLFEMNTVIFHCIADFDVYLAQNKPMDILILDLGLPDGDGIEVAKRLANYQHLRIVMLTARSGEKERIEGFQAGGDVYLTKPVSLDELSIVVKRLSDRLPTATDLMANWLFDPLRDTLTLPCGKSIALSTQESMMVQLFVSSEQQIVTREMFQNVIWRREDDITNQRLLVNIGRLRTKLKLANKDEEVIKTHWNIGYQFLYPLEIVM